MSHVRTNTIRHQDLMGIDRDKTRKKYTKTQFFKNFRVLYLRPCSIQFDAYTEVVLIIKQMAFCRTQNEKRKVTFLSKVIEDDEMNLQRIGWSDRCG